MHILFIGGTKFVGRHAAEAALRRGHQVTLLHRGSTGAGVIEGAEEILCDREGDLSAAAEKRWDAVIDVCGYVPRVVRHSASALKDSTDRYLFVSTVSVYEDAGDGTLRMIKREPIETETVDGDTYGPLKIECEQAVTVIFGSRSLLIRPGIVAGPYDPTNRFTYWVQRIADGGPVLVPDLKAQPVQLIDARDLGEFMILAVEKGLTGSFDVTGEKMTFGSMMDTLTNKWPGADLAWASEEKLKEKGVELGSDLPLTFPSTESFGALMSVDCSPAVAEGLVRRPLCETAVATKEWVDSLDGEASGRGLTRERELELLASLQSN